MDHGGMGVVMIVPPFIMVAVINWIKAQVPLLEVKMSPWRPHRLLLVFWPFASSSLEME